MFNVKVTYIHIHFIITGYNYRYKRQLKRLRP